MRLKYEPASQPLVQAFSNETSGGLQQVFADHQTHTVEGLASLVP
jgi:hypothetical protein